MKQSNFNQCCCNNRLWSLFILFFLCIFPVVSQADEDSLKYYVTPEFPESQVEGSGNYFDLNLSPSETETLTLKLQNGSSEPVRLQVTPHTAYTNVHGVAEYGKDATEPDNTLLYSLDELIEPIEVVELAGNETKIISLSLHMPEQSFEGFLAGGLRISEVKEEQEETTSSEEGVAIKNEFAYVIGVVVSNSRDSVQPDLELLDVFADQLNYRNVISATIQNFTPTFVNGLAVEATVQRVGEEEILYEASEERMQMAPNSHFHFPISLDGDRFQSGEYLVNVKATSGEEEWSWTKEFTIKSDEARSLNREDVTIENQLNWWMIGSITLFILLMIILTVLVIQKKSNKNAKYKEVMRR